MKAIACAAVIAIVVGACSNPATERHAHTPVGARSEGWVADRQDADVATTAADVTRPATSASEPTTPTPTEPTPSEPAAPTPSEPTAPPVEVPRNLVWGKDATAPSPRWTRPVLNGSYVDPTYGTVIRRITSAAGTRFDRNAYSRRQAENADGTLVLTYHGDAEYHIYHRATTELVRALGISPDAEPQWHPTDPAIVRHIADDNSVDGTLELYETDVRSGVETAVADLTERLQQRLPGARYMQDGAEGSPSADGARHAWVVYDAEERAIGVVSYDLSADRILGVSAGIVEGVGPLDWVSASPTGAYVVAGYRDATYVYDADLTNRRKINNKADHSDIALDAAGGDAYVYIDFSADVDGGWLVSVDLDTLARTRLFDAYDDANTSIHVSGKGYAKPGWVVVSTYSCKDVGAWTCEKVMAVELTANPRILNLAHTYNCGNDYWTETHAVVNRDFTRVYFNTDSGSCGIAAEVMEISVPSFE